MARLACLSALLAVFAGCTSDGGASFFIVQNQRPEEGCVIPSDLGGEFISRGTIDIQTSTGYLFTPVVQSLLAEPTSGTANRIVFVQGADVTLSFQQGLYSDGEVSALREEGLANFRQPFSGAVPPGGSTSFDFEIIPAAMIQDLAGRIGAGGSTNVVAEVSMFGTVDGGDVDAEPYNYNVLVCDGCQFNSVGACAELDTGFVPELGGFCQTFQDGTIDCCDDPEGNPVCPAAPPPA